MIQSTEYFVTVTLLVQSEYDTSKKESAEFEVSNNDFSKIQSFVERLNTSEGVLEYMDTLNFEAEFTSISNEIYRKDVIVTLVAKVDVSTYATLEGVI